MTDIERRARRIGIFSVYLGPKCSLCSCDRFATLEVYDVPGTFMCRDERACASRTGEVRVRATGRKQIKRTPKTRKVQ